MPAPFATLDDFFRLGVPPAACVPQPRPLEAIDQLASRILAKGHGMRTGDIVKLDGAGTPPSPLTKTERYAAAVVDTDLFGLVYVDGPSAGVAVVFTTAGTLPLMYRVDPRPAIEAELTAASSEVRDNLTGHSDVEEGPDVVKKVTCTLAAYQFVFVRSLAGPSFTDVMREALKERKEWADRQLAKWLAGRPVAGLIDATPTKAEGAPRTTVLDGGGAWAPWGGL